jgi:hypothetical protein
MKPLHLETSLKTRLLSLALAAAGCNSSTPFVPPDGGAAADLSGAGHDLRTVAPPDFAAGPDDLSFAPPDLVFTPPDLAPPCGNCAMVCCGIQCVDTSNDPTNCGACGNVCDINGTCQLGRCVLPPPPDLTRPPIDGGFMNCACSHPCLNGCVEACCVEDIIAGTCTPNVFCLGG